ncbi:hypothetical protein MAP00_008443 [Monascus purpureus]|nr:hypothetical protein MAP00_008443 [Monascus purpureus]
MTRRESNKTPPEIREMPPKVLVVLTSQSFIPVNRSPTGWYLPELAHFYAVVKDKVELTFASPKGGEAPLDPASVKASQNDPISTSFLNEERHLWANTHKLAELVPRALDFEAIYFVGGHGPMFDLTSDIVSLAIIQTLSSARKIVAAVCHGPAALVNATTPTGTSLIQGSTITAFSNEEEDLMNASAAMPFPLETQLNRLSGGGYMKAEKPGEGKVVISETASGGPLVTGQNPASTKRLAEVVLRFLGV